MTKIGIGIGVDKIRDGGFCGAYKTVYDSLTTKPSASIANAQNTMVSTLVSAGIWGILDVFYVFAQTTNGDSEALKNWITPGTYDATLGGVPAPAFVALEGFTSNGTNGYIDCNWNPVTHGVNYTQNSASGGCYSRDNVDDNRNAFGAYDGTRFIQLALRNGATARWIINDGTVDTGAVAASTGAFILTRTAANARGAYRNKVLLASDAQASTGMPNTNMFVLARSSSGVPANLTTRQISCFFAGGGFISNLSV